jgi:hypothetical protein
MEVFTLTEFKKIEYARDLLRPFDFIPAVDQLMYAPLVAASSTYFGDVDDADPVRDDVRRFSHHNPSPRLVYNKLLDVLGPDGMDRLGRKVLGQHRPLRAAAAEVFGAELDWFWRQWLGPRPRVNYRLGAVRVTSLSPGAPGAGVHVAIDVLREGDDVLEPVEVEIEDRAGDKHPLRWNQRGAAHTFELDLPAGLKAVEIDPRGRLIETALGSLGASDDPRADNRQPRRWRLIYEGFGGLLDVSQLTAAFAAAFMLKPQHDLRTGILLRAYHSPVTTIGVGGSFLRFFGDQADKNSLRSAFVASLSAARLDPSFGLRLGEAPQPGYKLSTGVGLEHDSRDYIIDPWRAVGLDASVGYSLTALENGTRLSQVGASAGALRLIELLPGHVLALDATAGATFGDLRLSSQYRSAGGSTGLRGYFATDLQARADIIGRVQLRDDYFTELNWNLLHFTTVRALAGTLFADVAAISNCNDYRFSRRRVFTDVGYSFRVLHDAFGVYQQLLSIDLAVPLGQRAGELAGTCTGNASAPLSFAPYPKLPGTRLPFVLLITFLPNF